MRARLDRRRRRLRERAIDSRLSTRGFCRRLRAIPFACALPQRPRAEAKRSAAGCRSSARVNRRCTRTGDACERPHVAAHAAQHGPTMRRERASGIPGVVASYRHRSSGGAQALPSASYRSPTTHRRHEHRGEPGRHAACARPGANPAAFDRRTVSLPPRATMQRRARGRRDHRHARARRTPSDRSDCGRPTAGIAIAALLTSGPSAAPREQTALERPELSEATAEQGVRDPQHTAATSRAENRVGTQRQAHAPSSARRAPRDELVTSCDG